MKTIKITVESDDKTDNRATNVILEKDRGAGYVRMDSRDVVTNKDKDVQFKLRPGERLVIEGHAPTEVVYDRDQGAAFVRGSQKGDGDKIDEPKKNAPDTDRVRLKQEQERLAKQAGPDGQAKVQGIANNPSEDDKNPGRLSEAKTIDPKDSMKGANPKSEVNQPPRQTGTGPQPNVARLGTGVGATNNPNPTSPNVAQPLKK